MTRHLPPSDLCSCQANAPPVCVGVFLQVALQSVKMANAVASYDQLAHQVEALRKENSHLRRELEDNSNHLSKLETETFGMKVSVCVCVINAAFKDT